jgi:ankyrin repeat protein
MSPVPSETVHQPERTADGAPIPQPPQPGTQGDSNQVGGVQALPNEALDLAARLFNLAREGSEELITYLKAGVPSNLTNNRGDTLLMLAAYHGHNDLVKSILTIPESEMRIKHDKADPNQLNGRGQSIVAGAVFKGYDQVIHTLIEHGADPLAGQPSAEDTAKMFNRWEDGDKPGLKNLFEQAPGRGKGAREAADAVPDREENQRAAGSGPAPA